jgi:hypothetical protein
MAQRSIVSLIVAAGGLLVWAAHFALLYGMQTASCIASAAGWSAGGLRVAGVALTAVAVAALLGIAGRPHLYMDGGPNRESTAEADSAGFLRRLSIAGAGLALLAMLWAMVPLLLLPACGPAAA